MAFVALLACLLIGYLVPTRNLPPHAKKSVLLAALAIGLAKLEFQEASGYSDSHGYFYNVRDLDWYVGTAFVSNVAQLVRPLVGYDNIYAASVVFLSITLASVLILYDSAWHPLRNCSRVQRRVFDGVVIVGVAFWGAGIGKDAFSSLGVALLVRSVASRQRPRLQTLLAGGFVIGLVRPHIAAIALMSFGFASVVDRDTSLSRSTLIGVFVLGAGLGALPFVAAYVGLEDEVTIETVSEKLESRTGYFQSSGSYVDLSGLPPPLRVASFLLRPTPIEARSLAQFLAAGQNLLLLFVLYRLGRDWRRIWTERLLPDVFFMTYATLGSSVLGLATSNLGLAMRQKFMFGPAFAVTWACLESRNRADRKKRLATR